MYSISSDILSRFQRGNKQYARLTYGNNNTIENNRIVQNSFSINRYVVTGESIGIGSTVAAELAFVLRNTDGAFDDVEFLDEEAFVEIGVEDGNHTVQYVPFGYYTFVESIANRSTINLTALDRMLKFEKTVGTITFPITVSNLLAAACTDCGVTLDSSVSNLVNGSYSVTSLPDSVKTWREVLQWIGEITGTNAYITRDGKLMLAWFASSSSMSLTTANRTQSEVGKDTISLTGVTILSNNTKYTAGTNTRPLIITDNGLITHDHQSVANAINTARNGYSYSSFTATVLPTPHLDPLDVIAFVKGSNNILCPVTDITFKLNGNTELGCKSDQTAHGRSYGLQDATFYAHNIAANSILADKIAAGAITTEKLAAGAVTADKISVNDLQALGATIGGFDIGTDRIVHYYKDSDNNEYYLRIMSPIYGANTQGIEVLVKPNGGSWDNAFAVKYNGWMMSKNCDIEGVVKATSGLIGNISISNGAIESLNGNFKVNAAGNLECTGGTLGGWEITSTEIRKVSGTYAYDEFILDSSDMSLIITHPTGGTYEGREEAQQTEIGNGVVKVTHGVIATGGVFGGYEYATLDGRELEVHNYDYENGGSNPKQGRFGYDKLIVANKDILRTHQSLVGGWGTAIPANANLNTDEYCEVGRFYVGADSTAATHTNCPTRYAYMMDVFAPISSDYENTSYIVREIRTRYGDRYVQYVTGSTTKTYSKWAMQLSSASDNKVFADQITSRNIADNSSIRNGSFDGQGQETSSNTRIRTGYVGVLPNTQYGIRTNYSTLQVYEVHEYTSSQTFIKYTSVNSSSIILKTSSTTGYIRVLMRYSDNRILTPNEGAKLQIERGEQLSAYTPYEATDTEVTVPPYTYTDLGTATTDSAFFQAWLKRIAVNFDAWGAKVLKGRVTPNASGVVYGMMYGGVTSDGFPRYSGFTYVSVGIFKYFGTNNGAFYLRSVNYTSEV